MPHPIWTLWPTQIYTRDTRLPIPSCIMALSAMGLNLGVFGFLPTTHAKASAKQMPSRYSRAAQRLLTCDCLHAQTTVHARNLRTWQTTIILITGKMTPKIEPHAGIKMAQGLVCLVYICGGQRYHLQRLTCTKAVTTGEYSRHRTTISRIPMITYRTVAPSMLFKRWIWHDTHIGATSCHGDFQSVREQCKKETMISHF